LSINNLGARAEMTNSRLTVGASAIVFLLLIFVAGCS
jgi:hypothetical protein